MGKSGIERTYEELLRGEIGTMTVEVNALSRPIRTVNVLEPVPGHNIVLTLDAHLQRTAEEAFLEHIQTLDDNPGTQTGAVLAMNPKTGEILAMASIPSYNPELLNNQSTRNEYYSQLIADARLPLFNRATQALYGPGSTFKPITALAILEEGILGPKDRFNATGVSQYGVKDWVINSGLAPFGLINLNDALGMSSNHYFADNGAKVGIDRLSVWMEALVTAHWAVVQQRPWPCPSREWKPCLTGRPQSEQNWYPTDTEQISIGQGSPDVLDPAGPSLRHCQQRSIFTPQIVKGDQPQIPCFRAELSWPGMWCQYPHGCPLEAMRE